MTIQTADKIRLLDEKIQGMAFDFIKELDDIGFGYKVLETWRSDKVQKAYFSQGRDDLSVVNLKRKEAGLGAISPAENTYIITKCDGVKFKSNHQLGKALDVVPVIDGKILWNTTSDRSRFYWIKLGDIGKKHGFKWGGDWDKSASKLGWDCPHFEVS